MSTTVLSDPAAVRTMLQPRHTRLPWRPSPLRHAALSWATMRERPHEQHRKGRPPHADPGWVRIQLRPFAPQSFGGGVPFEVATAAYARGDGRWPR